MSEAIKEESVIEVLRKQHRGYLMQREQFQVNLNQIAGAIFAIEQAIHKIENPDPAAPEPTPEVPPVPEAPSDAPVEPCEPVEASEPAEHVGE